MRKVRLGQDDKLRCASTESVDVPTKWDFQRDAARKKHSAGIYLLKR